MTGRDATKTKRPRLTHFLCLPLVNSASLPQLESSLASFKDSIRQSPRQSSRSLIDQLIPDAAMRPVGTLHLTLGVMSLPTRQRLDEALSFFESIDLVAIMRQAEAISQKTKKGRQPRPEEHDISEDIRESNVAPNYLQPFRISLESLHALPHARTATVLYAAPVDSSSRLHPFCEILRDKFTGAGFLVETARKNSKVPPAHNVENMALSQAIEDEEVNAQEMSVNKLHEPSSSLESVCALKPRPLLLHATIVNTIYATRHGQRGPSGRNNDGTRGHKANRYSFDARDIVAQYRDSGVDTLRAKSNMTQARPATFPVHNNKKRNQKDDDMPPGNEIENNSDIHVSYAQPATRYPFLWAEDFPLESICICEMGAKKLGTVDDIAGLNRRLGEKYTVVAERRLDFGPAQQTSP